MGLTNNCNEKSQDDYTSGNSLHFAMELKELTMVPKGILDQQKFHMFHRPMWTFNCHHHHFNLLLGWLDQLQYSRHCSTTRITRPSTPRSLPGALSGDWGKQNMTFCRKSFFAWGHVLRHPEMKGPKSLPEPVGCLVGRTYLENPAIPPFFLWCWPGRNHDYLGGLLWKWHPSMKIN